MRASVIPARRMPTSLPLLDYAIPEELQSTILTGQLVRIPFRSSTIFGVILHTNLNSTDGLRPLSTICSPQPILSEPQLHFLQTFSAEYHISLGFMLKSNLPPLQPRILKKMLANEAAPRLAELYDNFHTQVTLYSSPLELAAKLQQEIPNQGEVLILGAEINQLSSILELLTREQQDDSIILSSNSSTKENSVAWHALWQQKKRIVIGTRRALFLPWANLTKIIIIDEINPNFKNSEMAPRYHTRDAARMLAEAHGTTLTFLSHTPSVELYQDIITAKNPRLFLPALTPSAQIIDMRQEKRTAHTNVVSFPLWEKINEPTDGNIFLFLNRRGSAAYAVCRDCGNISRCDRCGLSFTFFREQSRMRCLHCGIVKEIEIHCTKCGGEQLRFRGAGTETVEKEVTQLNTKYTIVRMDSDVGNTLPKTTSPTLIVGTAYAWPLVDWANIRLMAFLDCDLPLVLPEYKSQEELWFKIRDVQFRLPKTASLCIQTHLPEHPLFSALNMPHLFYETEIQTRKLFAYPPFCRLIKLYHGYSNQAEGNRETGLIYSRLCALTGLQKDAIISHPTPMNPVFYKGSFWYTILIKVLPANHTLTTAELYTVVPLDWKIDINPHSLLGFS